MTEIAVILHNVPQNGLVAHRDHRFWNRLGIFPNSSAETSTKQHDLHTCGSLGSKTATSGIGTTNLPPQSLACRICRTISCCRFHGRIKM